MPKSKINVLRALRSCGLYFNDAPLERQQQQQCKVGIYYHKLCIIHEDSYTYVVSFVLRYLCTLEIMWYLPTVVYYIRTISLLSA